MISNNRSYFYDSHCHLMTLSQPNLYLFLQNIKKNLSEEIANELSSIGYILSGNKRSPLYYMNNMLSVMENSVGGILDVMEDDLRGKFGGKSFVNTDNQFVFAGKDYNQIVLTPLIMDFNIPGLGRLSDYYYPSPVKSLDNTVIEIFNGIREYYKKRDSALFMVLPFIGINPRNYSLKELEVFLEDHFSLFSRSKLLTSTVKPVISRIPGIGEIAGSRMFSGLKVYPPLGFDPWPEDNPEEMKKVRYLYKYCAERQIPITAHCDDQGFRVIKIKTSREYTSPDRWENVLNNFPELYLNLAHFGMQYTRRLLILKPKRVWFKKILSLINKFPNVYTDFSYNGINTAYYKRLKRDLDNIKSGQKKKVMKRVLFGTDFVVNLNKIRSYNDYFYEFEKSVFSEKEKSMFGSENPESFLYTT